MIPFLKDEHHFTTVVPGLPAFGPLVSPPSSNGSHQRYNVSVAKWIETDHPNNVEPRAVLMC